VVDGTTNDKGEFQPRSKDELDRIAQLVRSAVGFDAKRGDSVTVDTMHFIPVDLPTAEAGGEAIAPAGMNWQLMAGGAGVAVLGIGIMLFLRKRRRKTTAAEVAAEQQAPVAAVAGPAEPLLLASEDTSAQRQLIALLQHTVDTRPDEALAVIRGWIAEAEAA
jgi:flagellar M-ring protein FliF